MTHRIAHKFLFTLSITAALLVDCVITTATYAGTSNSLMDISLDGKLLACANRDSGTVSIVDLATHKKLHEVKVGQFYLRTNELVAAQKRFEYLLKTYPDYVIPEKMYFEVGEAYLELGDRETAIRLFDLMKEKYPDKPKARGIPFTPSALSIIMPTDFHWPAVRSVMRPRLRRLGTTVCM